MSKTTIPSGYRMPLSNNELQRAIELIHQEFQHSLCVRLNLHRVSAPLFVDGRTGLNDDLNGVERPVSFDIPDVGTDGQVVHSLAKWKRLALKRYEFPEGTGLYTNMNAIRRDEEVDNLHSIYVDQWDWEKHISPKDRNVLYLKETVRDIVGAICDTSAALRNAFPALTFKPDRDVYFITTQELEDRYPDLTPNEREVEICRKHHTVFLMQIGKTLASGKRHDGRAPDYDDWELNGDILMWNPILERSFELSSMGIRVDAAALDRQLTAANCNQRRELPFHKMLLNGQLPQSIGGGIGQSRVSMLLLGKAHIGEVQSSLWDEANLQACKNAGIGPFGSIGEGIGFTVGQWQFWVAVILNFFWGALMDVGFGLYAPCMATCLLLGCSGTTCFPVFMGSCALLMPANSIVFIKKSRYDVVATLGNMIGGCIGVFIAWKIITSLPMHILIYLVCVVLLWTSYSILSARAKDLEAKKA